MVGEPLQILRGHTLRKATSLVPLDTPTCTNVTRVHAVQHIRRMRGGAQSHLMRCSDGNCYVVKFQNNPQHVRVLTNELLASLLARQVGLSVLEPTLVFVSPWLVEHTLELTIDYLHESVPCQPGLHFGSRFVLSRPWDGQVMDFFPVTMLPKVRNLSELWGMLLFDKWTGNSDSRQAVYWRNMRQKYYTATFIDHGYCFNAGEWAFPDTPLGGTYFHTAAYQQVTGWESFEPWLSRIESLSPELVRLAGAQIPREWLGGSTAELDWLVHRILERRSNVRTLVTAFRDSMRKPFPNWGKEVESNRATA